MATTNFSELSDRLAGGFTFATFLKFFFSFIVIAAFFIHLYRILSLLRLFFDDAKYFIIISLSASPS